MSTSAFRFEPTCDLCDRFLHDTTGAFRVLPPGFHSYGAIRAFSGPVVTVRCFEDNTPVKAAVESPGEGRVLVVDAGGSLRRAVLGGKLGAAAARNGWAGVVIDGCLRDVEELAQLPVGLLALAAMPMPTVRKTPGETNVPIMVRGVRVWPGDYLVADADGVVLQGPAG